MNQENREEDISDIQDLVSRLLEKSRSMSKKISELERDERQASDFKANAEVRIKLIESERDRFSDQISDLDRRLRIFELNHDNRKERWNAAFNFVIQLLWVSMAAFLLTKLGLQAPL